MEKWQIINLVDELKDIYIDMKQDAGDEADVLYCNGALDALELLIRHL